MDDSSFRGLHSLIAAHAELLIAREAGELDEALADALNVLAERWSAGSRDVASHASMCWSVQVTSHAPSRPTPSRAAVAMVRTAAAASTLVRQIEPWLSQHAECFNGTMSDASPWMRAADMFGFAATARRVGRPHPGSGLLDQADEMLAPMRVRTATGRACRRSPRSSMGCATGTRPLHRGLAVAVEHGARRSAVDLLEALAVLALDDGRADEAARLAGAADAERERLRAYRFRPRHARVLAELRSGSAWRRDGSCTLRRRWHGPSAAGAHGGGRRRVGRA